MRFPFEINDLKPGMMKYLIGILALLFMEAAKAQCFDRVDFSLKSPKPIVLGNLNGKPAYFLIDTGSDVSFLDLGGGEKYGYSTFLRPDSQHKVASVGNTSFGLYRTSNVKLMIGSQRIKRTIFGYDISNIVDHIDSKFGVRIAGVIGSDVMMKYDFKIDYQKEVVMIRNKNGCSTDLIGKSDFPILKEFYDR